jgi:hypothetical protein
VADDSSLPTTFRAAAAPTPAPRIADADRDAVIDRLRQASTQGRLDLDEFADRVGLAYRSSTQAELDHLTRDLPPVQPVVPRRPPTRWTVGVFSSERRTGAWRPARPTRAWATFGSCHVDLAEIDCDDDEVVVRATAVFGGVEVIVPAGAQVELGGFAVFGSKGYRVKAAPPRPGFPFVRVVARAVFGSVSVRQRRRPVP